MSFGEFTDVFRKGWSRIIVGALVGLLLGVLIAFVTPERYSARTSVAVTVGNATDIAGLQQGEVFAEARARTYAGIAESDLVQNAVTARLQAADADAADRAVIAQSMPQTSIISIEVTAGDAEVAAQGANLTVEELGKVAATMDGGEDAPAVRLVELSTAQAPSSPAVPQMSLYAVVGLVAGTSLGFLLAATAVLGRGGRERVAR